MAVLFSPREKRRKRVDKRGDMSINIIVIAAIALIVLIVLVAIFTGRIQIFGRSLDSCTAKGGVCETECGDGFATVQFTDCPTANDQEGEDKCCVGLR